MNLFVCDTDPVVAAQSLPDKHVVKMCIENAQMLAVAVGSLHGYGWGNIRKKDGTNYSEKAHFNHPSTKWVRASLPNLAWTITHGLALCDEYSYRYEGRRHASRTAHEDAEDLFNGNGGVLESWRECDTFARAMPEDLKFDETIDDVTAYRRYLVLHKPWAVWKVESRKPTWWDPSLYTDVSNEVQGTVQDQREVRVSGVL